MTSNFLLDKSIPPSVIESLPFNEFCIYLNDYIEELKQRKKNADEQKQENDRMRSKMESNRAKSR